MEKMISCCGLNCLNCPAFQATKNNDDEKRKETALKWSTEYKADIKPEHINCSGCISKKGPLFQYCTICEIRKCCNEKKSNNCAFCEDYSCEKLTQFFNMVPDARTNLEEFRTN